jgi:hypothetical protein
MKSFRYIAILLGMAALLAGCVSTEIVDAPEREISFSVGSYAPATKAVAVTEFTSFRSRAFLHAEGIGYTQHFFGEGGETITLQSAGLNNEWNPSHPYYWPKSSRSYINFVSWYDAKDTTPSALSETALAWNNYTVLPTDNLLWADEAWRFNDNVNPATYGTVSGVSQGIPTLFHHALAQVRFQGKIKSGCDSRGTLRWEVRVKNMNLAAVYNTGSLALTNEDPETPSTTREWTVTGGNWTPSGNASTINMVGSTGTQITTTATDLLAMQSVLPQAVTSDMVLSFDWEIRTYRGSAETPFTTEVLSFSRSLLDIAPVVSDWTMGHRITYTLEFDPSTDTIVFSPALDTWNEADAGVVVE